MTKRGTLKLLPLFLFLFLAVCACKDQSTDNAVSKNGMLYYAEGNSGEWVIVGIADPASINDYRAAFVPKTGYWYVIGIGSELNAGEEPVSMGTITVQGDGSSLIFSPFTDMGFPAATFTGTLDSGWLTMDSIPGKNYRGLELEEGPEFNFKSSDDPWGTGGSLPSVPGAPDFGGGDDGGGGGQTPSTGSDLNYGKFVSDVIILDNPNVSTAYEGFPVDLTGLKVEIRYNNGDTATKTASDADEFIIDPPVYTTPNGLHSLRYIGEYNNPYQLASGPSRREFRAPNNSSAQGSAFYEMLNPEWVLEAEGASSMEFFDGIDSYDFSGVSIKALYSNGEKTIYPNAVYKTFLNKTYAPETAALNVYVGRRYALIAFPAKNVRTIRGIQLEGSPNFSAQVLYDDPRFFSGDAEKHWLSKYNNVSIKFLYDNTTTATKSVKLTRLLGNGIEPSFPATLAVKEPKLTFTYRRPDSSYNTDFTVTSAVPVYNKLAKITVESTTGGIILKGNGPLYPDNEESFLRQIEIKAFYQLSTDKNNLVVRNNILIYPPMPQAAYINKDLINASSVVTNVNTTEGGILNASNSKSYDTKKKLAKAKVSLTTRGMGDADQETTKSATIEIGVTGYTN